MPRITDIIVRQGTLAQWLTAQTAASGVPVLNSGELAWETDTKKLRVGDGTTLYGNLPYEGSISPIFSGDFVANDGAVFNELGGNYDFRVEGVSNPNVLFADASENRVGIGTNTPASTLHVNGETRVGGNIVPATDNTGVVGTAALTWNNGQFTNLTVDSTLTVTSTLNVRAAIDLADSDILRFGTSDDWEMYHSTHNYIDLNTGDLIIRDDGSSGDPVRVYLSRSGNFGINTNSPSATLDVNGSGIFSSGLNISNQTANTIASFDNDKNIVSLNTTTYPSLTELSYVKGVTSDIQTQINSHAHGNISSGGAIGGTSNLPLITTTAGLITTGSFGTTANTFCQGNDSRLSDTRTPTDNTVTTAKIVNDNVTYAKIQNVSATDKVLGRSSSGSGDIEEITCTSFGRSLIDDASASDARTTLGVTKTIAFFTASDNQPPAANYATLDTRNSILVLDFDDSTTESAIFAGMVPEATQTSSGFSVVINWIATSATSGGCVWQAEFLDMDHDTDSLVFGTAVTDVNGASSPNGIPLTAVISHSSLQIDGLAAGDFFLLRISRLGGDASDTMSGDAELVSVEVRSVA